MDNKELKNEQAISETIEEVVEGTNEVEVLLEDVEKEITKEAKTDSKAMKFFKRVLAGIVDQVISISIALIVLLAFDFILKFIGFYIAKREPIFLMIYVIVNILYRPICSLTKLKDTIGIKIMTK